MDAVSKILNFGTLQAGLKVLLGAGVIYLAFNAINLLMPPKNIVLAKEISLKITAGEPKFAPKYPAGELNRQLFRVTDLAGQAIRPNQAENETIADLALMGVLSGQNPQAIIQNKKTQKTYYLGKGQFLGQFLLEEIGEGKIILKSNNQNYELYL